MNLTAAIKNFALDLGYSHVGITTADDFDEYRAEIEARGELYDFYLKDPREPLRHSAPRLVYPWARSIIVLAYDYMQKRFPENLSDSIGRAYLARCYNTPPHRINGARFGLMLEYLQKHGLKTQPGVLLPARLAGARAGIINFGCNNFAYAKGSGSFLIISNIITDAELEYDRPSLENKCPPHCRVCMDACPTKALYAPFKLNPRKCIPFNNFRTTVNTGFGVTDYIPRDIRSLLGRHMHGCDVCQLACPRNAGVLKLNRPQDAFLEKLAANFDLRQTLALPEGYFKTWLEPILFNYLKEKRFFQRNAAVAMGNSGDQAYVPDLTTALENQAATVRGHAAWALGRLGGQQARGALEKHLAKENDADVQGELKFALAMN